MSSIDRLPPHSIEAEEAVLGSLLIDPDAILEVASFLKAEAFYREQNRWIYQAILDLHDAREPLDFITLTEMLRQREQLDDVGGEAYLIGLLNAVPTSVNAASYGRIVEAAAVRRGLIQAAGTIANLAYDEDEQIAVVIDRAEQALFGVSEERTARDLVPVREIARSYMDRVMELAQRGDEMIGVPTGFQDIDRLLGGLNKSDLLIVAARPGMGKCVTADTRLVDPQSGALTTIERLVRRGVANVLTLDSAYQLQPARPSRFVDDGIKPAFKVTTALGREIKVTLSHPFLTIDGWKPLADLSVGDHVAVPRQIPVFGREHAPEHEVKVLAYLLGDGGLTGSNPKFTNGNARLRTDFANAVSAFPGTRTRVEAHGKRTPTICVAGEIASVAPERQLFARELRTLLRERGIQKAVLGEWVGVSTSTVDNWLEERTVPTASNFSRVCTVLKVEPERLAPEGIAAISGHKNSLRAWLESQSVWGEKASEKRVPESVFRYDRESLALFLNRLFACDGSVYLQQGKQPVVSYATASRRLAQDLQHLLLRFGIIARLRPRQIKYAGGQRPSYQLRVTGSQNVRVFLDEIGIFGKEAVVARVRAACENVVPNANLDVIPLAIWERIRQAKGSRPWAELNEALGLPRSNNLHVGRRAPSRERTLAWGEALDSKQLISLGSSDVYWDKIVSIDYVGEQPVYDLTIPETHNFVANDVIVHNTAFQLGMALHAGLRHGKRIAIFNLEMSGEQLVQRLIAAETRIDSQRLRRGQLHDNEWQIFGEAIGRLAETNIFIDDTPAITPMQLRTKCRRLYAEHGLDMVMIDYLQLMHAEHASNNRVQEISEISRGLKGLARELDVPVVTASQLSRAVESRQDKRPQLSDLRDSGCLSGDTLVTLADSGRRVPIQALVGKRNFKVLALNEETLTIEPAVVSDAFATGIKQVLRLTTRLGRTIRATANHQFRTFDGWKRLDELSLGDRLALPRSLPTSPTQSLSDHELALLAHLIGDGCTLPRHVLQYTSREEDLAELVASLAKEIFGSEISPRVSRERRWYQVYLTSTRQHTHGVRNAISEWLSKFGAFGLRSHEKFVPGEVFAQPREAIGLFLRHLWATDGSIQLKRGGNRFYPQVYYASSSKRLAVDVQSLLLRLGINARLKLVSQGAKGREQYHVLVSGKPDLERFVEQVGAVGTYKQAKLREVRQNVQTLVANTNRDVIPSTIWRDLVVPSMQAQHITAREMQARIGQTYCGTSLYKQNVSRERAARVAEAVGCTPLVKLATSDVYWDEIVAIEAEGEEAVYDLTVPGFHNFVADDIVVHNSIEQDADIVMFIYRDEYYHPDTTDRPNIAEISVAKHRNGPTGVIDLYWQANLATFRNLQRQEVKL